MQILVMENEWKLVLIWYNHGKSVSFHLKPFISLHFSKNPQLT